MPSRRPCLWRQCVCARRRQLKPFSLGSRWSATAGGAQDAQQLAASIEAGCLPQLSDVTFEGCASGHSFDIGNRQVTAMCHAHLTCSPSLLGMPRPVHIKTCLLSALAGRLTCQARSC